MQARRLIAAAAGAGALLMPAAAYGGHGLKLLDHPAPAFAPSTPLSSTVNSGGPGAEWELVTTIPTGNPHTDVDFFSSGGETFMSAGTLSTGPNGGGQSIVQLTQGGAVAPKFIAGHPSATCLSDPQATLSLQHDVEATPKPGGVPLNAPNPSAALGDAQLLLDATDAEGRCHDQTGFGLDPSSPQGGLEIVDVTTPSQPKEIGLIRHIGEAHTVNVDPKRPHIAYAVTSDSISLNPDGSRQNEDPGDSDRFDLDGFEVVDLSSCMNFPAGTSIAAKRAACRPEVYRYRYPSAEIAPGHTLQDHIYACHELEVYPDDRLTCGSGNALAAFDMSGAFNNMGTPSDYTDDQPVGTPLPCRSDVPSASTLPAGAPSPPPGSPPPPFATGARVTDCVDGTGEGSDDLTVAKWISLHGSPSLQGVEWLGSIHHQGRGSGGAVNPTFDSTQDIDFNHEAELSASGNLLLATDERGGGVAPPGATCPRGADNTRGNGGVHFYRTGALHTNGPLTPDQEFSAYARTPDGEKAIIRVPIRTQPRATVCTAHVFHQIPGQNRIFMGWYSQGTHVIDFLERPNGTVELKEVGWFIPENSNQWVSAVFKTEQNRDGTSTYYGATGDFNLGEAGRNAMDIYRVRLPPAPSPGRGPGVGAGPTGGGKAAGGRCPNVIKGTRKGERIVGTSFGDTVRGKGGRDKIRGGLGGDCAFGNKGRDRVRGQQGNDVIKPGKARDHVVGGAGKDRVKTRGGGRDRVRCGPGKDVAKVDNRDRVKGCEKVKGKRKGKGS